MATYELDNLATAIVFEYPNPFQRGVVEEWARSEDFDIEPETPNIPFPEHIGIEPKQAKVGSKDRFGVMFNPEADLHQFGDCAFVTIADEEGGNSEVVLDNMRGFLDYLAEDDLLDQKAFFEITFEGFVRVGNELELSRGLSTDTLDVLADIHGGSTKCGAVRITSDDSDEPEKYFKLLFDSEVTGNPNRWRIKYIRRFMSIDDFDKSTMMEDMRDSTNIFEVSE